MLGTRAHMVPLVRVHSGSHFSRGDMRVGDTEGRGLSDDQAREIAKRLLREAHESPQDHDGMLSDTLHGASEADEDRIERAVVELGAAGPEVTTMAERAACRALK
jgi:hypothetical protein